MWWLAVVVGAVAVVATYLTWTAARVERLHARAATASAALAGQLDARAKAALALADAEAEHLGRLAEAVRVCAHVALESLPDAREAAENDLTQVLRDLPIDADSPALDDLHAAGRRVQVAKQVHTDVVRDALAARTTRAARLLRVSRKLPRPHYFNIDDPR
ncbi:hypothetical protein [Stackebrandtia nassauensis]|uniref:NUDIX hydrolase n=1 Tax=Stackebrandtia nassauensis (strain DSM 44728 / CIP 108903 / NRRL B-16338 / NBRC 102104 / LLR-40K-21) TaxID=446470 RepID=D3Q4R1_STANL|nr:hypothetical protein [Stackebrandtia nassauensis]ADD42091.1 hypothetical protein Snas_2408 [Stackebrandtia nassauensis DSM 44728]